MKNIVRILFLKNVGNPLDGEKLKYIISNENNIFTIEDIPLFYNGKINSIINKLCYDFDELSIYNQQRYEKFYIELKRVNNNIYSTTEKTYSIKRDLFT